MDEIRNLIDRWQRAKGIMLDVKFRSICENNEDTSVHTITFTPSINLGSLDFEIGLLNLETYYSFPNIDARNSNFKYWSHARSDYVVIQFETGTYNLDDLNHCLAQHLEAKGDDRRLIHIRGVETTGKCEMRLLKTEVDFTYPNSINSVLGFENKIYGDKLQTPYTYHLSEKPVTITNISSIYVNCDLVDNSYVNGLPKPVIYSFFPKVAPNNKIVEVPPLPVFLPINKPYIDSISFWLTDQDGNKINFRGEFITICFYLKKISLA
jgi:hypothetical protein